METRYLHDYISKHMIGRIGMLADECTLLGDTVKDSTRHLEIGTLWGGSALVAAMAGAKQVYTIDLMSGGWWDAGQDPKVNPPLGPKAVIDNLTGAKLRERIVLVVSPSNPFPLDGLAFETALIDGDHSFGGVRADFHNVYPRTSRAIMFHDCEQSYPGVMQFINSGEIEAAGWSLVKQVESLRVYEPTPEKPDPVPDSSHPDDSEPEEIPARQPGKSRRSKRP
jgi:hypothetical protein